jgi:hypothetical protein
VSENSGVIPVAVFCGQCNCGCPAVAVDPAADAARQVVISDDFGQRVEMSRDQFADLIAKARSGALDGVLSAGVA